MPWARFGDNAATYPQLLAAAAVRGADDRTVNELAGFVFRLACQIAAHTTDYLVDMGTVQMIGGGRWRDLIRIAERVDLLERTTVKGLRSWRLREDDEWIHIRTQKEMEWNNRQRNDTRDAKLMVPLRLRDGDQCRWCQVIVIWSGPRTNRSATVDHLNPGDGAESIDDLVIACFECNQERGADRDREWARSHELHPAPARPEYGAGTVKYLAGHGHVVQQTIGRPAKRSSDPDPARSPQPNGATPVRPGGADTATGQPTDPGESPPLSSHSGSDKSELAGSGRVGDWSGLEGEGRAGSAPPGRPRRRGRRGGRPQSPAGGES